MPGLWLRHVLEHVVRAVEVLEMWSEAMKFSVVKHEELETSHYPPAVAESYTEYKVTRAYAVTGEDRICTQVLNFGRKRRRFLIERIEISWVRTTGQKFRRRSVSATGPTVLVSGEISQRSSGYESWWRGEGMPDDVAKLLAEDDTRIIG